jgi:hypothetical protein
VEWKKRSKMKTKKEKWKEQEKENDINHERNNNKKYKNNEHKNVWSFWIQIFLSILKTCIFVSCTGAQFDRNLWYHHSSMHYIRCIKSCYKRELREFVNVNLNSSFKRVEPYLHSLCMSSWRGQVQLYLRLREIRRTQLSWNLLYLIV